MSCRAGYVDRCHAPSNPCTQTMRCTPCSAPSSSSALKYGAEEASRGTSLYMNPGSLSCFSSSLAWRKLKQNIIKDILCWILHTVFGTKRTTCWTERTAGGNPAISDFKIMKRLFYLKDLEIRKCLSLLLLVQILIKTMKKPKIT